MSLENEQLTRIKHLTQSLIVSGFINIFLLSLFFYWLIKEVPPRPYCELKPVDAIERCGAIDLSNADMIRKYKGLSFEQLKAKLTHTQAVENGYTERDLALGTLVTFHHFDLSKALFGSAEPIQRRHLAFGTLKNGKTAEVIVYPGLSDQQYQAIIHYAQTERWPMTSQGLFLLLHKHKSKIPPSLAEAFFLTPEFQTVETLFNRSEVAVEKSKLLAMISQGNWKILSDFVERQKTSQDLSAETRQNFLLGYIQNKSKDAGYLILKTDGGFAFKKLDDEQLIKLLNVLKEKSLIAEHFALGLLKSPRGDRVWQLAARRLYEYAGESVPEKNVYEAALARFSLQRASTSKENERPLPIVPKKPLDVTSSSNGLMGVPKAIVVEKTPTVKISKPIIYVVKEGDSLWKIAKQFKVSVEKIKADNHLSSDALKPGTYLKIPTSL